jgi:hypothetical protein
VNKESFSCEQCSSLCEDCEFDAGSCVDCWEFTTSNILNWLSFTCVTECSNETFFNQDKNSCDLCNPVCSNCTGPTPNDCIVCNKTESGFQLYYEEEVKECVTKCRTPHIENDETLRCENEILNKFFTPLVIIIIVLLGLSILILILSKIVSCI